MAPLSPRLIQCAFELLRLVHRQVEALRDEFRPNPFPLEIRDQCCKRVLPGECNGTPSLTLRSRMRSDEPRLRPANVLNVRRLQASVLNGVSDRDQVVGLPGVERPTARATRNGVASRLATPANSFHGTNFSRQNNGPSSGPATWHEREIRGGGAAHGEPERLVARFYSESPWT
jgi:hypothetical protein